MSSITLQSTGDVERSDVTTWPYRRILWHAIGLVLLTVGSLLVYVLIVGISKQDLIRENGLLEHAQVVFLGASALLGIATLIRSGTRLGRDRGFWRYVAFAIVCVSILGFTKEIQGVDFRENFGEFSISRSFKRFVRVVVSLSFVVVSMISVYRLRGQLHSLLRFCRLSFLWPVVPLAACLIAGQLCEEWRWVFAEETLELVSYSMLLVTCCWLLTTKQLAKRLGQSEPTLLHSNPVQACATSSLRNQRIA